MRRVLLVTAVVLLVLGLAFLSIVRVPAGSGVWCSGAVLGEGLHLKAPWASVQPYAAGERTLTLEREITGREGAREPFTFTIRYTWDLKALQQHPLAPEALGGEVKKLLGKLDGKFSGATIGADVNAALPGLLAELPIDVVEATATYPGAPFEKLTALARPTGRKVVLVALDGFDWALLDRLIAAGRCPTFARMKRKGASADLQSHWPVLSPLIWTSIATGRLPDDHGVLDFVVKDPKTGKDIPITNQFRKVHAFWNIMSYVGMSVDVANWWATYPAEPIDGVMVTERLFYQLFGIKPPLDDPANVYPPEVLQEVLPLLVDADDIGWDEVRRYVNISKQEYERNLAEAMAADNPYDNRINHLRKILAVTHGVFNVGRWMLERHPADLVALYIEGTDTIGHRFAHFLPPKLSWVSAADYRKYNMTMARYYELVDRELARLMEKAPPDTTWIVTADHGFFTGAARPSVLPDDFTTGAAEWHRMVGVFMAMGPGIRPGKLKHADIYDLCRTLLWLEGAPISRQLEGRELTDIMQPSWVEEHPPVYVDTYEDLPLTWKAEGARSIMDEARIKELQALGYLSPGGETAGQQAREQGEAAPTPTAPPVTEAQLEVKPTELYNRAKVAEERGDVEAARRLYLETLDKAPNFPFAMMGLARLESNAGHPDEALAWMTRALATGAQGVPPSAMVEFMKLANDAGKTAVALEGLEDLRPRWGDTADFEAARGLGLEQLGRTGEALAAYRAALQRDPTDDTALGGMLGLAARGAGVDVEPVLRKAFEASKGDLKRLNRFSVVCLRYRRPDWAERALKLLLQSDPSNAGVLSNLAAALQQQGKLEEAAEILDRAVQARPDDGSLHYNRGAVLAALGRFDEALTEFDAAARLGKHGPRVYAARAKMLVRLGRIDEARGVLEEGVAKNPGSRELRELLAAL